MGRSIVLYKVSLLSRDSCERVFISQLMYLWDNVEKYDAARQATDDNIILRTRIAFRLTTPWNTSS